MNTVQFGTVDFTHHRVLIKNDGEVVENFRDRFGAQSLLKGRFFDSPVDKFDPDIFRRVEIIAELAESKDRNQVYDFVMDRIGDYIHHTNEDVDSIARNLKKSLKNFQKVTIEFTENAIEVIGDLKQQSAVAVRKGKDEPAFAHFA